MRGYIKTFLLTIVIFGVLWYVTGTFSALDFVEKPELVFGLAILLIVILINGHVNATLHKIRREKFSEEEKAKDDAWFSNLMKSLTKAKPIEEEKDILLDHSYDGIKELDNDLPPWWLYGFYVTILFAAIYLGRYHIFGGDTQLQEFEKEMATAEAAIEEYKKTAKDLIDASTVEVMTDATDLSAGKKIFDANCIVCHLADGGGSIGPNLTDEYWILGGGISNIFNTISEGGRDGKGMIPWKNSLKPGEIAQVSSYIMSLQGTTPANPKAPEGEIWTPEE